MGKKKLVHGNSIYDLLVDLIFKLSPLQAENLYSEILPRYTKRSHVHFYNTLGEEDKENGKIRLMPLQHKAIRTKFGDTYMQKAYTELTNYIKFLEQNQDSSDYKAKLKRLNSNTHNMLLATSDGWVYNKCKKYIIKDKPKLNINPYVIEDLHTAKEYLDSLPKELIDTSMDVQLLLLKFPELTSYKEEE